MGTEGNGSTPDGYTLGVAVPSPRVTDSMVGGTDKGVAFIRRCIARYETGDLGDIPVLTSLVNHLAKMEKRDDEPDVVFGIYEIPQVMGWASDSDYLVVAMAIVNVVDEMPELNVATAAVLFLDEAAQLFGWDL